MANSNDNDENWRQRPLAKVVFVAATAVTLAVLIALLWPTIQTALGLGTNISNQYGAAAIVALIFAVIGLLVYFVAEKTLWDLLELLIVPLVFAAIGFWFTAQQDARQEELDKHQQERQQEIDALQHETENKRAQLVALEEYLNQMGTLLLDRGLRTSDVDDDVHDLARARTLLILDMLSPGREPRVLEFLDDMQLIQADPPNQDEPVISLKFADLRKIYLVKRHLLKNADLEHADLHQANLRRADLSNANLRKADLGKAKLSKAVLTNADLTEANLRGAKGISCQQTEQTELLDGTTMPNGREYEDWRKDKGCGND